MSGQSSRYSPDFRRTYDGTLLTKGFYVIPRSAKLTGANSTFPLACNRHSFNCMCVCPSPIYQHDEYITLVAEESRYIFLPTIWNDQPEGSNGR